MSSESAGDICLFKEFAVVDMFSSSQSLKRFYQMMTQNGSLKFIVRPPSWIFKRIFLMGGALETHLHRCTKFCGDRLLCCRDIARFEM